MFKKYFNACAASALLTGALMMPAMATHSVTQDDAQMAHTEVQRFLPLVQSGEMAPEMLIGLIEKVPGEDISEMVQAFVPYLTHQNDAYRKQATMGLILAAASCQEYVPFVLKTLEPLRHDPVSDVRSHLVSYMGHLTAPTTENFPRLREFFEPMTRDADPKISLLAASAMQTLNELPEHSRQKMDAYYAARPVKTCPALPAP